MGSKIVGIPNASKILPRFLKIPENIQKVLEKEKIKQRTKIQTFPTTTTNYNYNKDNNNNNGGQ